MSDLETLAHEITSNAECGDEEAVRALLQRYGDTRERAGIERAADRMLENMRAITRDEILRELLPAPAQKEPDDEA